MAGLAGVALAMTLLVSGCAPAVPAASPAPAASTPEEKVVEEATPEVHDSAEGGFRAWLELSRLPDAPGACALMTPALIERRLAEAAAGGMPFGSCEEFVTVTAEAYRAVGDDATVSIEVREETATDATLFVTYVASGKCGTVVMERGGDDWILTEQSEVCAA